MRGPLEKSGGPSLENWMDINRFTYVGFVAIFFEAIIHFIYFVFHIDRYSMLKIDFL